MGILEQVVFAYIAGLVVGGVAASVLELVAEKQLSFAAPFFSREHLPRFMVAILAAGPFMLVNDALAARRQGQFSGLALTGVLGTASIWTWALGTLCVSVAARMAGEPWI